MRRRRRRWERAGGALAALGGVLACGDVGALPRRLSPVSRPRRQSREPVRCVLAIRPRPRASHPDAPPARPSRALKAPLPWGSSLARAPAAPRCRRCPSTPLRSRFVGLSDRQNPAIVDTPDTLVVQCRRAKPKVTERPEAPASHSEYLANQPCQGVLPRPRSALPKPSRPDSERAFACPCGTSLQAKPSRSGKPLQERFDLAPRRGKTLPRPMRSRACHRAAWGQACLQGAAIWLAR